MLELQLIDWNNAFTLYSYAPENARPANYVQELPVKYDLLSKFLENRSYFAGENITYVDFIAYEYFDKHKTLAPGILEKFNNLKRFHSNIEQLPAIDKYMKSDKFMKWPLNNKSAHFGSIYDKNR